MALITFTDRGLYCKRADAYIDPWKSVPKALVTHGHSDHARRGSKSYLATHSSVPIIKHRLGNINIQGIGYGEVIKINGVSISYHPAGHIIGSAQIRLEYKGEVWVVSGDYKVEDDGISEPFESVRCNHFVTESTFGLPVYKWEKQSKVFQQINEWWKRNKEEGKVNFLTAYSLGKAQRLIHNVDHSIGKIFTHPSIEKTNEVIRNHGIELYETTLMDMNLPFDTYRGALIISPGSGINNFSENQHDISVASASGWMAMKRTRRRFTSDRGFVLSDHADWDGLNSAIKASGAENIYVTHGYTEILSQWLNEEGYNAQIVKTEFSGDELNEMDL